MFSLVFALLALALKSHRVHGRHVASSFGLFSAEGMEEARCKTLEELYLKASAATIAAETATWVCVIRKSSLYVSLRL